MTTNGLLLEQVDVLLFVLKVLLTLPLCHEVVLELHVQLEAKLEPQLRNVQ